MTSDLAPATTPQRSLVADLAAQAGLDPKKYYAAIKAQCGCKEATDADFAALLMTSQAYGLNPIMRQLYLMKTKKGVQVVIPIDGYLKLMRAHPDYLSHTCDLGGAEDDAFAEATIYTKAQVAAGTPPFTHREYLSECRVPPRETRNGPLDGPWQSHPRRMLQHKAMSQAVRYCFAIYTMDEDEWDRAGEAAPAEVLDVTPAVPLPALVEAGSGDAEATHPAEAEGLPGPDPEPAPTATDGKPRSDLGVPEIDMPERQTTPVDGLFDG